MSNSIAREEKDMAILNDYMATGNAYKTLIKHGYSETTAKKQAKQILDATYKRVLKAKTESKELTDPKTIKNSLEILGVSREEVTKQLKTIALNDKDYTNALKVLTVLAKDINLDLVDDNSQKTPSVSLTIENREVIDVKEADTVSES